jgi:hypothetical protein
MMPEAPKFKFRAHPDKRYASDTVSSEGDGAPKAPAGGVKAPEKR